MTDQVTYNPDLDYKDTHIRGWQIISGQLRNPQLYFAFRGFRALVSLKASDKPDYFDIQTAINTVYQQGGGTILIKNGTYILNSNVTLYSNVSLVGEDKYNTILDFNSTTFQILINGLQNVKITNLTLQNGRSTTGSIYLTNSVFIKLSEVRFINNSNSGGTGIDVYIDNTGGICARIDVSYNSSSSPGTFVYLKGNNSDCWFFENFIASPIQYCFQADLTTGGSGFFLHNFIQNTVKQVFYGKFTYFRIINNVTAYSTSSTSTSWQIDLTGLSFEGVITGNQLVGYAGIQITGASTAQGQGIQISSNNVYVGTGEGLKIDNTSGGGLGVNVQIIGNHLETTGANNGVTLISVYDISLDGNYIKTASGIGISLSTARECKMTGNSVYAGASGNDGIKLLSSSYNNTIVGNYIQDGGSGTCYPVNISDVGSITNAVVGNRLAFTTAATNNVGGASNIIASNA